MNIGIFGGTFNPPHIGHLESAKIAVSRLDLDKLIVIPAGKPPHKNVPAGSPSANKRLKMTQKTFKGVEKTEISEIEISNDSVNYTVDTVEKIKSQNLGATLYLLVGTDMYLSLETWNNSETLLKEATPAVFSRSADETVKINDYSRSLKERLNVDTVTVANDYIDISSSRLREMLPQREGTGYIIDATYAYIIKHRLYGAKPDWGWLRSKSYEMLEEKRKPHVAGCELEALRLAEKWNVGSDNAREAAILHDITKKLSTEEHEKILDKHAVHEGRPGRGEDKLYHSMTGALIAAEEFGISDAVKEAIRWHTTGKPGMTALEKIIYLADYIEPTRNSEGIAGLGKLRELAYSDLDAAMTLGLQMSIQDMIERGITPNRMTHDALADIRRDG